MMLTKPQLRRLIREELRGVNMQPSSKSNWYAFSAELDVGVLDLDNMAYNLGFNGFDDMDASIAPRALAGRDPRRFIDAARDMSAWAGDMSDAEILTAAGADGEGSR